MVWLAVDEDGEEYIYESKPERVECSFTGDHWNNSVDTHWIELPKGSIEKPLGRSLTWKDEAVCVE